MTKKEKNSQCSSILDVFALPVYMVKETFLTPLLKQLGYHKLQK